ncbi:TPA: hypothetical protein PBS81_002433 [Staphylococcus aureus]|nr:hypothetical protein [Staphylococcus aureus]HDG8588049.1 hypothetical protein [Staphylococcus aureus]HDZ3301463.1 hypothetical protein [Staphylococcus aureus]HDZ3317481.1 hypothetical protein [Staphylococcus aureus]HDZ3342031.1 hypothetical protein [Staphylococcus aureus]
MRILKESIIVAFAFVGVVVGAGFATGQEIFQFFTSHGAYSISGIIVTGLLITLGGMIVMHTGHHLKSKNHSDSINYFLYPSIARGFDIILTMFMLSLAIIMTAGGASTIHQSFNLPYWLSALILVVFILATLFLKFDRLIAVLGGVTPFLIAIVIMITVYYFTTSHLDFTAANNDAQIHKQKSLSPGWWFDAINYASLQIAAAFSFLSVMGSKVKYRDSTLYGGLIGGLIITFLLMMINLGLISQFDKIKHVDLPTLKLATQMSPSIGIIMSVIMILVIYNTVVGLMYAFASRFSVPFSRRYFIIIITMAVITYISTFIGFISLIGKVFPIMGLFGFILLIPVFYKGLIKRITGKSHID